MVFVRDMEFSKERSLRHLDNTKQVFLKTQCLKGESFFLAEIFRIF